MYGLQLFIQNDLFIFSGRMGYENVKKKIAEYTIMIAVNREMIGDVLCSIRYHLLSKIKEEKAAAEEELSHYLLIKY